MFLHNVAGVSLLQILSGAKSSRVMNTGRLGEREVVATQAKAPPKIECLRGEEPALLSELSTPSSASTRSIHTLLNLSYHQRVGNEDIWLQTQGLSGLVKS
ncbi:hypothetical protein [Pluralibacter sp.]|jgi:hypothetical protein|uniref:hypothetical protein n=1 Tax=Pluralibacter sp. TaxID=1920032 RepID=UPI0025E7D7E0|nr:hypothetical protein [Pluralibacter sp.]MBV8045281.1 hypothetical protein [Pluralibacter sp.]